MSELREPCVPGLFTEEGGASLLGARCRSCGTPYFPAPSHCRNPSCAESALEPQAFGGGGTLWSYSVANFAPPAPHRFDEPFRPYVIGVVDLDQGLRVVGQMVGEAADMRVGARVDLVVAPIYHEDGKAFTSWKFELSRGSREHA
ncbi:Zn-ribbon domain-containing OB-fold protein [Thauera butanivorans]|uniref:Zn-ribbon domain-containing OB-fold protein n=1 Tax=Thauera butanivorans TaxID=86174 RepID=UPI000838921D|nr:OB-fold domain-containing protein [Thauera butanivorans]